MSETMRLSLFVNPTGHHQAAWRHPGADADAGVNLGHYVRVVQAAERAGFDALFLADNANVRMGDPAVVSRVAQFVAWFEPLTLLSALAMVTERIGLIATMSTSTNEPYHVARRLASLDHISGGRAGWNIVTSGMPGESPNFGDRPAALAPRRYEVASEFTDVCLGLWDSWEDDAFPRDAQSGVFSDPTKMHTLDHEGEFFSVRGPLNVPRSPQGRPLLVQAGASDTGSDFAARYADMVFATPLTVESAIETRTRLRGLASSYGRDPDHLAVMPGLPVLAAETAAEAEAQYQQLQDLVHPDVAINTLRFKTGGIDYSSLPLDEPLPEDFGPQDNRTFRQWYELGEREGLTLLQLATRAAGSLAGTETLRGSASSIADVMEEWFTAGGADGFNIQPPFLPGGFEGFTDLVIPELRRRGLVRATPEGKTLREHFRIPRPPWQPPGTETRIRVTEQTRRRA